MTGTLTISQDERAFFWMLTIWHDSMAQDKKDQQFHADAARLLRQLLTRAYVAQP